jgi:penicillin-binding protein 1A
VRILRLVRFLVIMIASVATLTGALAISAPHAGRFFSAHVSEHEKINLNRLSERSYIYDRYGQKIATIYYDQNRVPVKLEDVPEQVTGPILAAEDDNFFNHKGVNVKSVVRAFNANIESGGVEQGGSTITQQLVKNSITGNDQDVSRKVREAVLAVELEKEMSKNEILERYLNTVYFGNGAYGVQAAAEVYFQKDVGGLSWAEGSLLAALIRSPNDYNPIENPELALERRRLVLRRLVETKRLDQATADLSNFEPLPIRTFQPARPNDYFVNRVQAQLREDPRIGPRRLYEGGLRIYTTFDPNAQQVAKVARDQTQTSLKGQSDGTFPLGLDPKTNTPVYGTTAVASVEPSSGAVRVLLGGPEYTDDRAAGKIDLTTEGLGFQPGSSFKTILLAAAMEAGYTPNDTIDGTGPCGDIPGYEKEKNPPGNFGGSRGSVTTLTEQTKTSSNCAFLRLGAILGLDKVIDMAHKLGITTEIRPYGSIPIGTELVHPLDMAVAYATIANDGVKNQPYFVDRVQDSAGTTILEHQPQGERVMSSQSARLVTQMLKANVDSGTAMRAKVSNGQPAAGKTGTTNDAVAVWFVGYTPQLSTAIWMGAPTGNISLGFGRGLTGGRLPAATFGQLYSEILKDAPIAEFPPPAPVSGSKFLPMPGKQSPKKPPRSGSKKPTTTSTIVTPPGNGGGNGGNGPGNGGGNGPGNGDPIGPPPPDDDDPPR